MIESFLAQELTATQHAEVAAHIAACAACRARAKDFRHLDALLREMPREVVPVQLSLRIQRQARARAMRRRLGHALPVAIATLFSVSMFIWLASETWLALQDRALWELIIWFVNVPEILWRHPGEVLAGFAEFAPIGGLAFTLGSAFSSWLLGLRLLEELRSPVRHLHQANS